MSSILCPHPSPLLLILPADTPRGPPPAAPNPRGSPGFCLPCVGSQRGPPLSVIRMEVHRLPPSSTLNHNQSAPADRDGLRGQPRPPYLLREDAGPPKGCCHSQIMEVVLGRRDGSSPSREEVIIGPLEGIWAVCGDNSSATA